MCTQYKCVFLQVVGLAVLVAAIVVVTNKSLSTRCFDAIHAIIKRTTAFHRGVSVCITRSAQPPPSSLIQLGNYWLVLSIGVGGFNVALIFVAAGCDVVVVNLESNRFCQEHKIFVPSPFSLGKEIFFFSLLFMFV